MCTDENQEAEAQGFYNPSSRQAEKTKEREGKMNIEEMTIEQLKALAFDMIVERDRVNANLQVITARIAELSETKQDQKKKPA